MACVLCFVGARVPMRMKRRVFASMACLLRIRLACLIQSLEAQKSGDTRVFLRLVCYKPLAPQLC